MQYSTCLSPHGVDLIPVNLPSRVWGSTTTYSNDRFHFNTNGNCNNTNHQVTFVRYNPRMYHTTNRQLPPAVIPKDMPCGCFPPNPMLPQQHLMMSAIQRPPPPWPFTHMTVPHIMPSPRIVPSRIMPSPYQPPPPPLLRPEPTSFQCYTSSTLLHAPQWDSCLQPITSSIVYNQLHQPSSQDKELPSPLLSKQADPKLTTIPPLIDMSGVIEASAVDDVALVVSPKPLCIVLEENNTYCELVKDSTRDEAYSTSPSIIAESNSDNNLCISSLIDDANYVPPECVSEAVDINNVPCGTSIVEPVSNNQLPFADFLDKVSPLHSPEQLSDNNNPVPMEISLSDDEFDSQIPNYESHDHNCPGPDSNDSCAAEQAQSPLILLVSDDDLPLPPSPDQIHCNSLSPDVVEEQSCRSTPVQSHNDSQRPSHDQLQSHNSPASPDIHVASEEQFWSPPLVLVSQSDGDFDPPVPPSPNHLQCNSPSPVKDPMVVSIPLGILPQLQDPSPLVVSLPIKYWKNAKQKTKKLNSQDDTMALQTLEEIFKSSTLLSSKDENLIRQFMKGEDIECFDRNITRYALSKVLNTTGDVEYATVELDLVQKQWRGIMINAKDATSITFHNDNHITS